MQEPVQRVDQTTTRVGDTVATTREVRDPALVAERKQNVAARVVWFIAGVILVLLAFRFVFVLLGANASSPFANFIYSVSYPFARPFFGLFSYDLQYGVSRFELSTLVAMAVYALIAWGIVKLITITQPRPTV